MDCHSRSIVERLDSLVMCSCGCRDRDARIMIDNKIRDTHILAPLAPVLWGAGAGGEGPSRERLRHGIDWISLIIDSKISSGLRLKNIPSSPALLPGVPVEKGARFQPRKSPKFLTGSLKARSMLDAT
jgi:hypothetical protein